MSGESEGTPREPALARLGGADLNLLVPLLALLEERSVTSAAARVGLSQSAMSHALRRLRLRLGDEILVRRGSGMVLTSRAEELIVPVRSVLERSSSILDREPFDPSVDRRVVNIALTTSTAFVFGSLLMRTFAQHAPHVVLQLQTTGVQSLTVFAGRNVDVALLSQGTASPISPEFTLPYPRERLYDDRWVLLASPTAPGAEDRRSALELIEQEPHLMYVAEDGQRVRSYDILDAHGISYAVRARVTDYLLIPHLLSESNGVALNRYQVGIDFHRLRGLRVEEFPLPAPDLGVDIVWNPWLSGDTYRSWLREMLFEAAEPLRARYTPPRIAG